MGAEIVDRFGPPPPEVALLIKLVTIKAFAGAPMSKSSTPARKA